MRPDFVEEAVDHGHRDDKTLRVAARHVLESDAHDAALVFEGRRGGGRRVVSARARALIIIRRPFRLPCKTRATRSSAVD